MRPLMPSDLSTVSFATRTQECAGCGTDFRHGFIFTGPAPTFESVYVCLWACAQKWEREHVENIRAKYTCAHCEAITELGEDHIPHAADCPREGLTVHEVGVAVNGDPTYVMDVPTHEGRKAAERRALVIGCRQSGVDLDRITICSAYAEEA